MTLYKVITEQKVTKKVLVVVDANSDKEALDKVGSGEIISIESTLDMKIEGYLPLESEKY